MYTITKEFTFSASHQLAHLPDTHPCSRLHGHNYRVQLILTSPVLDERGFVVDYNDLAPFGDYLASHYDHRHLNDVCGFVTTAENIAKHLYDIAWKHWHTVGIHVRVSETPRTWAEFGESS